MANVSITRRSVIAGAAAGAALAVTRSASARPARADLTRLSIADAAQRIAARELSPLALTEAYLERIDELNPRVNAYITVTGDQALRQARGLESELASGRNRGPLHGIPIALKDNIDTAGIKTTAASAVYAERVPADDAPVVTKLRDAGAVFLGKLNMHEFAFGGTSAVTHYGPVRNPWNLAHVPGGSSGGSAAAVSARMCAAALGTDTAASIRYPAAVCGVVGLKATHGLASIRGIIPLSAMHDHVGPISRSVEDSAILMSALAGFDPLDSVSIEAPRLDFRSAINRKVSELRIGVPRSPFFEDLDPEIETAMNGTIAVLKGMTSSIADVDLPAVDGFAVLLAEIYEYHAKLVADPAQRALYKPLTLGRIQGCAGVSSVDYVAAHRRMVIARNTSGELFRNVDVLVTPTAMRQPVTVKEALAVSRDTRDAELIRNTLPFNVYGIPTISVPCGFSRSGLPIGLQISGPRLGELNVLALAHAYERATDWHSREPPLR